ncbi:MAG: hypothetical protein KDD06_10355 [Phaeodactylibacter sp.]|nr:hypothetical protein [Phaeodactylibacter sp.]MCB9289597.1 hypothetical protein [Lewinellaceae bacterium]
MRYCLFIFLSFFTFLNGRAQFPSLLLQNSEYSGLMNPASTLIFANTVMDLRAGLGYRQAEGNWLSQEKSAENRLGFVESGISKNFISTGSGLSAGGYFFEERSQAFSMDAAYLNGKIQLFLDRRPGKEFFVAAGLNIGAVQHRIRYEASGDSSTAALLNPNFFKVLPDVSTGIYLSFPAVLGKIWVQYAIPPSFRFGKVFGENGFRGFISVGYIKELPGIGRYEIYNKLAASSSKFKPLDSFLSGRITDYIAGVSYAPYSIPIYGGVSFNTRQEKIYFDIGTFIMLKRKGAMVGFYRGKGLSFQYTFESKGKSFPAHSLGIVLFQNMGYRQQPQGHRYF